MPCISEVWHYFAAHWALLELFANQSTRLWPDQENAWSHQPKSREPCGHDDDYGKHVLWLSLCTSFSVWLMLSCRWRSTQSILRYLWLKEHKSWYWNRRRLLLSSTVSKVETVAIIHNVALLIAEQNRFWVQSHLSWYVGMLPRAIADDLKQDKPAPAKLFQSATIYFRSVLFERGIYCWMSLPLCL